MKDTRVRNRTEYLRGYYLRPGVRARANARNRKWRAKNKKPLPPLPDIVTLEYLCSFDNSTLEELRAKFSKHVVVRGINECWEWSGERFKNHYGLFRIGSSPNHRKMLAHRISFLLAGSTLKAGELVLHNCDNKPCVNPHHLRAGNYSDNLNDAFERDQRPKTYWTKGRCNGRAKLEEWQIPIIRSEVATASIPLLAKKYGVTSTLIRAIVNRKLWRHVQ